MSSQNVDKNVGFLRRERHTTRCLQEGRVGGGEVGAVAPEGWGPRKDEGPARWRGLKSVCRPGMSLFSPLSGGLLVELLVVF